MDVQIYQFQEKLISLMVSKALKNEKLPKRCIRVHDHNVGVDLIVRKGKNEKVYNQDGHSERNNLTIVKTILKQVGKSEDLITFVTGRKCHDLRYAIDSTKIEREPGWERTYTFEDGIKEIIDWYVNNQKWIDDILSGEYKNNLKVKNN